MPRCVRWPIVCAKKAGRLKCWWSTMGSTDTTARQVLDFAHGYAQTYPAAMLEIKVVKIPETRARGYSVRNGLLQAPRRDCDVHPTPTCRRPIREGGPPLCGDCRRCGYSDRFAMVGKEPADAPAAALPQFFGRCFNLFTRAVMGLPFRDTQCGFKAFTRARCANRLPVADDRTLGV